MDRKLFQTIKGLLILTLTFIFATSWFGQAFAASSSLNDNVKKTISTFFERTNNDIKQQLTETSYDDIIGNPELKEYVKLSNNYFIQLNKGISKTIKNNDIRIIYNSIDLKDNMCTVDIDAQIEVTYLIDSQERIVKNDANHIFTLKKYNDKWLIESDVYSVLEKADKKEINNTDYIKNRIKLLKEAYKGINTKINSLNELKKLKQQKDISSDESIPANTYTSALSLSYRRDIAVSYAHIWYSAYNPRFPQYSSDCTNFVSQCLYAGGIPMDSQWYCYSSSSVSSSWISVNRMYDYLIGNNIARCTEMSQNNYIFSIDDSGVAIGDVIQFYNITALTYSHGALVTVYDPNHSEIFYTSHSKSRYDYSLFDLWGSTWEYTSIRILHINA